MMLQLNLSILTSILMCRETSSTSEFFFGAFPLDTLHNSRQGGTGAHFRQHNFPRGSVSALPSDMWSSYMLLNTQDRTFFRQWCVRCITTAANSCNLSALMRSKILIGSFVPWLLVLMLFFPSVSVVLTVAAIRACWWGHCNFCHAEGAMCVAVCLQGSLSPAPPAASNCTGYQAG